MIRSCPRCAARVPWHLRRHAIWWRCGHCGVWLRRHQPFWAQLAGALAVAIVFLVSLFAFDQLLGSLSAAFYIACGVGGGVLLLRNWFGPLVYSVMIEIPRCATCSYDLTGNTSGVCPECGRGTP